MEANAKAFPQFLHVTIQFAIRPCSERSLVDGINGWNTRNGVLARKFAGKLRSRYEWSYSALASELKSGIFVSTSVPGSARDSVNSPPNWRTLSLMPAMPTPSLDE